MKKRLILLSLVLAITGACYNDVYAYKLWGHKLPSKSTSYKFTTTSSTYQTYWKNGMSSWKNYGFSFYSQTSAIGSLGAKKLSSTSTYGQTTRKVVNVYGELTSYVAYLNTSASDLSKTNYGRSTACHELGHAIGLADLSSGSALMSHTRNRTKIYAPQTDDINGVNAIY